MDYITIIKRKDDMVVSEKDLFNFVFWKESLSKQKVEYIINNFLRYRESIKFLQKLFDEFANELPPKIWDKLVKKLNESYKKKIFILKKNNFRGKQYGNTPKLCAQSQYEEHPLQVDTFTEETSNFFIKVFTDSIKNKIYFFADDSKIINGIEFQIYPSGKTFKISEDSNPVIISPKEKIENIFVFES